MAKNKIEDLRDLLFGQLERLNDDDITPDQLTIEMNRAKVMCSVGAVIVDTARLEVEFIETVGALGTSSQFFKDINPKQLS